MKILSRLVGNFRKFPGVGPKQAERFALYLLRSGGGEINELLNSITELTEKVSQCSRCFNYTFEELCYICSDSSRDASTICVVETAQDLEAIENTGIYKGVYHVLGGAISPLEGVEHSHIRLKELVERVMSGTVKEIIIATNPSAEGEVTADYINSLAKGKVEKISRIAFGVPLGGDIDYMDELTLTHSLRGRRKI